MIDSHLHLWRTSDRDYPTLIGIPELLMNYDRELLADAPKNAGVTGAIVVQAADSLEETAYLLDVADSDPLIVGVVGWLPLEDPSRCRATLEALSNRPCFRGTRVLSHTYPDPNWLSRTTVLESLNAVAEFGLSLDLVLEGRSNDASVRSIWQRVPTLTTVIDHLGAPNGNPNEPTWRSLLHDAGQRPNCYVKVSGLYTAEWPRAIPATQASDLIHAVYDSVPADRIMLGSDWPVSTLASDYYSTWQSTLDALPQSLTSDDLEWAVSKSASAAYNLH